MTSIYKLDYPGTADLQHSDLRSELQRWFDNYKLERNAEFADDHEWLTIDEKKFRGARRPAVRFVGTIGDVDELGPRRTVLFETNAPAPPTFHRPAKFRPEPKPKRARDGDTLTYEMLLETMHKIGLSYEKQDRMKMKARDFWHFADLVRTANLESEMECITLQRHKLDAINWTMGMMQLPGANFLGLDLVEQPKLPPPKRYRRNA